jgi:Glycosyltransferase
LKVLHVIPAVAPRYGGPSQVIFEMCRALRQQGADVLIATTDADGSGHLAVQYGQPIAFQDMPTIFFKRQWSERFGYSRPLARWLDRQVASFDVVHIHAVFSHPCIAAARACRRHRVPYIVRPLGSLDPWSMRQKAWRKRLMWRIAAESMLRGAAAIHYTTRDEQQLAESSLSLQGGVVIPLGIDLRSLQAATAAASFLERHAALDSYPYVLALSRIHPKKNIELLLDVFLSLAEQPNLSHWRLVIAGDGEADYVASLQTLVRQRPNGDKVIFTGWLDGIEKRAALQSASLFALPSRQENFGIAVVESLACGVPAIVSEHVNLAPEIASHNAGWVTALDADEFSRTLAEALGDEVERQRRGRAAHEFAAQRFSWEVLATQLISLYASFARKEARFEARYSVS